MWMLHSKTLNNKINRTHERELRTVYSDYKSSLNEILDKDGSFAYDSLKKVSKVYQLKFINTYGLSPIVLGEVFKVNETIPYDLRMRKDLYARNPKTVRHGTEIISFLSPKFWALIPETIKDFSSFLKRALENGNPCRLCKTFLQHVGFIELNSRPPSSVLNLFEVHITCSCCL